jgi:hypothetical protein
MTKIPSLKVGQVYVSTQGTGHVPNGAYYLIEAQLDPATYRVTTLNPAAQKRPMHQRAMKAESLRCYHLNAVGDDAIPKALHERVREVRGDFRPVVHKPPQSRTSRTEKQAAASDLRSQLLDKYHHRPCVGMSDVRAGEHYLVVRAGSGCPGTVYHVLEVLPNERVRVESCAIHLGNTIRKGAPKIRSFTNYGLVPLEDADIPAVFRARGATESKSGKPAFLESTAGWQKKWEARRSLSIVSKYRERSCVTDPQDLKVGHHYVVVRSSNGCQGNVYLIREMLPDGRAHVAFQPPHDGAELRQSMPKVSTLLAYGLVALDAADVPASFGVSEGAAPRPTLLVPSPDAPPFAGGVRGDSQPRPAPPTVLPDGVLVAEVIVPRDLRLLLSKMQQEKQATIDTLGVVATITPSAVFVGLLRAEEERRKRPTAIAAE